MYVSEGILRKLWRLQRDGMYGGGDGGGGEGENQMDLLGLVGLKS